MIVKKPTSSPFPGVIECVSFTPHSTTWLHNLMFTVDYHAVRLQRKPEFFNLQHIPQYAVGTKTISVNSEKWKLPSNITEFSSKLPITYFFSISKFCLWRNKKPLVFSEGQPDTVESIMAKRMHCFI